MSEEALRRFLDRVNADATFFEQVKRDLTTALNEFELSRVEQMAVTLGDEDALRRLAGMDVSGYMVNWTYSCAPSIGCTTPCPTYYPQNCPDTPVDPMCSMHIAG